MLSMTRFVLLTLLVAVLTIADAIKVASSIGRWHRSEDGIIYNSDGEVVEIRLTRGFNDQRPWMNWFRLPFCCVQDRYRRKIRRSRGNRGN